MQSMVAVVAKSEIEKSYGEREKKMLHLMPTTSARCNGTHIVRSVHALYCVRETQYNLYAIRLVICQPMDY